MTDRSLRLLLDFDSCAKRDEGQSPVFLHRRDRKFALSCEEKSVKPSPERWLAQMNHFSGPGASIDPSAQTLRFWGQVNSGFLAVGAVFGLLTMIGLLFYDGGQRINITIILAFVAFQLLLAILTTVQSLVGWQPWRMLLLRFKKTPESTVLSKLQPVLMARAAQLGGMSFALSGLVTLLLMVVLQDLAFGWSTTLETDASSYHWIVTTLALPWAWAWPAAVPDFALVEATRFFRAGGEESNISPDLWGQWWPFIAMLWTTWALLPRVVLYLVAGTLIRRKAGRLLSTHPSMHALLYRMETPSLETGNEYNDASDQPNTKKQLSLAPLPSANILLCWAGAGDPDLPTAISIGKSMIAKIGGRMTLAEDQKTLEQVAIQLEREAFRNVLIITRSWEPPTGELDDFLSRAEEHWPKDAQIVLVPLATSIGREPNDHQVQQWLRFAKRTKHNFVTVSIIPVDGPNTNIDLEVKI